MRFLTINAILLVLCLSSSSQSNNSKREAIEFNDRAIEILAGPDGDTDAGLQKALLLIDSAIAIDHTNCLIHSNRLQVLIKLKKLVAAAEHLNSVLKFQCQQPAFYLLLGVLQETNNNMAASKTNYSHALEGWTANTGQSNSRLNRLLAKFLLDNNLEDFKNGLTELEKYDKYEEFVIEMKKLNKRQDILDIVLNRSSTL